jgi:hypothetical protein
LAVHRDDNYEHLAEESCKVTAYDSSHVRNEEALV